ncbi:MAG TPA: TonB-dependent receptor [Pyrinomonadaceae bacterium]|nr:TonB-dependent receptor [Pyrinomonadaceae bacterium]
MKNLFRFILVLSFAFATSAVFAQDIQTKGSIGGIVRDANGAALPGAKVTVTGAQATRDAVTGDDGSFTIENLTPGLYDLVVENPGFKKASATKIEVNVGKQSTLALKLEPGDVSATVDVSTSVASIDSSSTAVGKNLSDQLFQNIPVQRTVSSLFYLAPAVNDSLGGGRDNPSISGGSALDNLYIADGVNITDSAFGGLGTFSRSYGALGTGINTSFVKEVQVKTGGFEPQYGQSTGGIINIITQSGGNEFHGAVYGYARPKSFEATRKQPDDFRTNLTGKILHPENYDAGVDFGGPILKNKLFFFTSFNPTINRTIVRGAAGSGLLTLLGPEYARRIRTYNYAEKVDWNINSNHTLAFSLFGDPSKSNKAPFSSLNIQNATAMSILDFGTRNASLRYNGALSPSWTVSASLSQNKNHFDELGFDNLNLITDSTRAQLGVGGTFTAVGRGFIEPTKGKTWRTEVSTLKTVNLWGQHNIGFGYQFQKSFYSGTRDRSGPHFTVPSNNATGNNPLPATLPGGQAFAGQDLNAQFSLRTLTNADGTPVTDPSVCPLCPVMSVPGLTSDIGLGAGRRRVYLLTVRGEFGAAGKNGVFDTFSNYHAAYAQDTWRFNKHLTAIVGLRTEQERIVGNPGVTGKRVAYSFTDQFSPRLGFTVDPQGKGKTKVFYNFGRYFEYLPLDLAERSLSTEQDFYNGRYAPVFNTCVTAFSATDKCVVLNQYGTVTPVIDNAHFLNRATGGTGTGTTISAQDPSSPILAGTKLGFAQEHVIGFEQQLPHDFVISFRYLDRRLKRIVEDAAVVSPEGAFTDLNQVYFIGNVNSKVDAATNPIPFKYTPGTTDANKPAGCRVNSALPFNSATNPILYDNSDVTDSNGATVGAICYAPLGKNGQPAGSSIPDGVADGFPDPIHIYKAFTIEVNKRFSNNWQLLSNWNIAKLEGNFEGHFRNDNGQTDPGISSLFDFTAGEFNLLGDQFAAGPLNSDRRHVVNVYGSYNFGNDGWGKTLHGLTISPAVHIESGVPINKLFAHPVYANAGEIPVGGRGSIGRTATYTRFDFHVDYPWKISERTSLKFIADFFNVFNSTKIRLPDQNFQNGIAVPNVDFLKPVSFYTPFNLRLGLRFEF